MVSVFPECEFCSSRLEATQRTTIFRITTSTIAQLIPARTTTIQPSAGGYRKPARVLRGMKQKLHASTSIVRNISIPTGAKFTGILFVQFGLLWQILLSRPYRIFWGWAPKAG